jgi:hypothetical protein
MFGCALNHDGLRKFPRPLVKVTNGPVKAISSISGFFVFIGATNEVIRVHGRDMKSLCMLATQRSGWIQDLTMIGNTIFALSNECIETFDCLSGELLSSIKVPATEKWISSVDQSCGAIFIGAKCYSISRFGIDPLIDLYAGQKELLEQLRRVKDAVGSVAGPLLVASNRSPYLAATLLHGEISDECNKPPVPGTIQEHVRPILNELGFLLVHRPG